MNSVFTERQTSLKGFQNLVLQLVTSNLIPMSILICNSQRLNLFFKWNNIFLQSLSFIAGYAVHVYYKHSRKCSTCHSLLTEDKEIEIEIPFDSKYKLIQIINRGSLKWPRNYVTEVIVTLWKVFHQSKTIHI